MNKKRLASLGALIAVATPIAAVVSCSDKKTYGKEMSTTTAGDWIIKNSWSAYVTSNPNGESLDIPKMYNGKPGEEHNEAIFKKDSTKSKVWELKYEEVTKDKTDKKEVAKLLKDELLKINKAIKKYIVANNKSKFVIYCSNDTNNRKLVFNLKEINQRTGTNKNDVDKILDRIEDQADIDGPSFPELKGHILWAKSSLVETKADGKRWFTTPDIKEYPWGINTPFNDHKLKIKDSDDNNTPKTLDPRINDPETKKLIGALKGQEPTETQTKKIKEAEKKWVDAFMKKELLDKDANINSYPYIDYKEKTLKLMLVSSDIGSKITSYNINGGWLDTTQKAKELSYKVITIHNALPTTPSKTQTVTPAIKEDVKATIKASLGWIASTGGGGTLGMAINMTKGILPQVQALVEKVSPLLKTFNDQYKKIPNRNKIAVDYVKLPLYKNIDKRIDKIVNKMVEERFNLAKIATMKKDMLGTGGKAPYESWDIQFIQDSDGRNQAYLTNVFWLLSTVGSELI